MLYEFPAYPTIAGYIHNLTFFPMSRFDTPTGGRWIDFPARGGAYSSQSAVDALEILIKKKTEKYETLHVDEKLDELHLVAYYDNGLFYNTPYTTLGFGFDEIAQICRDWARTQPGKFQKIFLFDSTGVGKLSQIF